MFLFYSDMDEDQLDTLCLNEEIGSIDCFSDELICSTMRGRFRSNRRTVPRLPLAAMISRMKLLEVNNRYDTQQIWSFTFPRQFLPLVEIILY